jgi:hypothetical protein
MTVKDHAYNYIITNDKMRSMVFRIGENGLRRAPHLRSI